jgi:type IV pilus assembly protein PilC
VLGGILSLTGIIAALYLWPPSRLVMDRWLLRMPVIGRVLRLAATAQFSHGMGVLLRSGITLVEALRTVEEMHRNRWVGAKVSEARTVVVQGGSLAVSLEKAGVFMPMMPRMAAVGESTGTLDEIMEEVARFHENQLQVTIRLLSVLLEPAMVVSVGSIVGFVYIAFFVAMFAAAGGSKWTAL